MGRKKSWLDILDDDPKELWQIRVPIPGTAAVKRLGEFTGQDVQRVEQYYRAEARRMETVAECWHQIHRGMLMDDTLESAAEAGRISKESIIVIGRVVGEP